MNQSTDRLLLSLRRPPLRFSHSDHTSPSSLGWPTSSVLLPLLLKVKTRPTMTTSSRISPGQLRGVPSRSPLRVWSSKRCLCCRGLFATLTSVASWTKLLPLLRRYKRLHVDSGEPIIFWFMYELWWGHLYVCASHPVRRYSTNEYIPRKIVLLARCTA